MTDLAVVGQDPRFGGGVRAQLDAFVDAARAVGRQPELLFVPHPTLRPEQRFSPLDRVEALRLLRGSRRLAPALRGSQSLWVVSTLAAHGYAAPLSGRPYACWLGTSLADENRGRLPGLAASRRLAARANAPALARLERTVLRRATAVYATSAASRAAVARSGGLPEERIGVLPLPVDANVFTPEPDDAWLARLAFPALALVGRADDARKNVGLALAALPLIRARIPGATLRLIGPGAREDVARDGVQVLGEIESVAGPLRESSLLLLPSRQEGFGIVAAEALASGVPVVATPSGGPEELLARSAGGIVLSGWSAEELAAAATDLLEDVATLTAMRRQGREYVVREHSPARLAELLAAALAQPS